MMIEHGDLTLREFITLPFDTPVAATHGYILYVMFGMFVAGVLWGWLVRKIVEYRDNG